MILQNVGVDDGLAVGGAPPWDGVVGGREYGQRQIGIGQQSLNGETGVDNALKLQNK